MESLEIHPSQHLAWKLPPNRTTFSPSPRGALCSGNFGFFLWHLVAPWTPIEPCLHFDLVTLSPCSQPLLAFSALLGGLGLSCPSSLCLGQQEAHRETKGQGGGQSIQNIASHTLPT